VFLGLLTTGAIGYNIKGAAGVSIDSLEHYQEYMNAYAAINHIRLVNNINVVPLSVRRANEKVQKAWNSGYIESSVRNIAFRELVMDVFEILEVHRDKVLVLPNTYRQGHATGEYGVNHEKIQRLVRKEESRHVTYAKEEPFGGFEDTTRSSVRNVEVNITENTPTGEVNGEVERKEPGENAQTNNVGGAENQTVGEDSETDGEDNQGASDSAQGGAKVGTDTERGAEAGVEITWRALDKRLGDDAKEIVKGPFQGGHVNYKTHSFITTDMTRPRFKEIDILEVHKHVKEAMSVKITEEKGSSVTKRENKFKGRYLAFVAYGMLYGTIDINRRCVLEEDPRQIEIENNVDAIANQLFRDQQDIESNGGNVSYVDWAKVKNNETIQKAIVRNVLKECELIGKAVDNTKTACGTNDQPERGLWSTME